MIPDLTAKGQERRDDIIAKADVLIRKHGYEGMTLRMLAREVGISCGHLEHYFKEKKDLLLVLTDTMIKNLWIGSENICKEWNDPFFTYAFAVHWFFLTCSRLDDIKRVTFQSLKHPDIQQEFSSRFALHFWELVERSGVKLDLDELQTAVQMSFAAQFCNVCRYDDANFTDQLSTQTSCRHIEILFLLLKMEEEKAPYTNGLIQDRIGEYGIERLVKPFTYTYKWYEIDKHPFKV